MRKTGNAWCTFGVILAVGFSSNVFAQGGGNNPTPTPMATPDPNISPQPTQVPPPPTPLASARFDIHVSYQVYCNSYDGIPITDTNLKSLCCPGGTLVPEPDPPIPNDPTNKCRTGFDRITASAASVYLKTTELAMQQLKQAEEMKADSRVAGVEPAFQASTEGEVKLQQANQNKATLDATVAKFGAFGKLNKGGGGSGGSGGAGNAGNGVEGNGASGNGLDKTAAIDRSKLKPGETPDHFRMGAYTGKGSYDAGQIDNSTGKGVTLGTADSNASAHEQALADGALAEKSLGEKSIDEESLDDDSEPGLNEDPGDYFSRISKDDNLFKIVSKRYATKKYLFRIKFETALPKPMNQSR